MEKMRVNMNSIYISIPTLNYEKKNNMASHEKISQTKIVFNTIKICK
jgi:hypothetical protein